VCHLPHVANDHELKITMLRTRLAIGFSMVGLLLAILLLDELMAPWFPLWLVLALVALGSAALELVELMSGTSARPSGNTVFGGVMALVLANWAPHVAGMLMGTVHRSEQVPFDPLAPIGMLGWPLMAFAGVVMAAFIIQSVQFQRPGATMATIAATVMAVAYVGLLGSFIIQMRWFDGYYHGIIPLAYLVATAKGADTGAYTLGRIAGRHKLWPQLSPNKTVEGAIGGLIFGVGASLIVLAVARYLEIPTLDVPAAIGFGLIVAATAQLGDLMESMIKRDCLRKDASAVVPGFGGVLDVLDSLLFAGPIAFGYWLWMGP
jgi:phosphatidate cytidylyltransferase